MAFGLLIALEVLVSILLILVVLMQSSKGGGLAGTFGGGSVGMVFGVRRTADFLIRATQILAGTFIVLSLIINMYFLPRANAASIESVLQKKSANQSTATTPQLPPTQEEAPLTPPGPGK